MTVKDELSSVLREQIYYKNYRTGNPRKIVYNFNRTLLMRNKLGTDLLRKQCTLLIDFIMERLLSNPSTLSYHGAQLIELKYSDPLLLAVIGKKRNTYYDLIGHLKDHEFLFKVKGSSYLVNPYFINNMTKHQWASMIEDIRAYDRAKLAKSFGGSE